MDELNTIKHIQQYLRLWLWKSLFYITDTNTKYFSLLRTVFCILLFNQVEQKKFEISFLFPNIEQLPEVSSSFLLNSISFLSETAMFEVDGGGWSFSWCCCVLLRWHTVLTLVFICFADNAYLGLSRMAGMQCIKQWCSTGLIWHGPHRTRLATLKVLTSMPRDEISHSSSGTMPCFVHLLMLCSMCSG